ncbi:uncharacterized protein [Narcine bancroftii]|uniref:uncharacterized protein n=1 Tax=Narcine bancroftii TaxID=1343680 RepID=UPI003831D8A6
MFPRRPRRPRETCCWREKEMKNLLEDPMGLAEQFDQFLGPNTYTWEEMHAIMGTLFSPQERQMIRQAALLMWEREQPGDPRPHEQKYPLNEPRWDKRTPEGLTNMRHYREWTIKGIREAVPKGHNFAKAFGNHQGKDESPTDFLERVRKNVQQYAGVDPSIRIEFVSKSWQDIRKKLEKEEDERQIDERVWYKKGNRGGLDIPPLHVTLIPGHQPVRKRQYPISLEGRKGLQPVIETLIWDGLLEECMSPYNTPILPVKKPDGSYRLVQDLRSLNAFVQTRHPVVPNPYTIMSRILPDHEWFSVIDLKDAFWTCPLEEGSRDMP